MKEKEFLIIWEMKHVVDYKISNKHDYLHLMNKKILRVRA